MATKKLNNVELDRKELFTKFNKANQTIGVLWFEKNFLAKKTKSLRQSYSKSKLSWRGLQVQSLTRCLASKNLLLIKPV